MAHFELTNKPPRTGATKTLGISSLPHEGMMYMYLDSGWSAYTPSQVDEIMTALKGWLDKVIRWTCPKCQSENFTTELQINAFGDTYDYKWVRCQQCKKKTDREKLGLTK
jgi:hypothetical protein